MGPAFSAVFLFTSSPCVDYMFTQKVMFLFLSLLIWLGLTGLVMPQRGRNEMGMERMDGMEGVWWVRGREGGTTTSTTINNNNQPTFINNAMRCVFSLLLFFFFHGSLSFACPLPREPPSPPLDILPLPYPTWDPHTNLWVGLWEGPTVGTEVHTVSSLSPSYSRTHARILQSFIQTRGGGGKIKGGGRKSTWMGAGGKTGDRRPIWGSWGSKPKKTDARLQLGICRTKGQKGGGGGEWGWDLRLEGLDLKGCCCWAWTLEWKGGGGAGGNGPPSTIDYLHLHDTTRLEIRGSGDSSALFPPVLARACTADWLPTYLGMLGTHKLFLGSGGWTWRRMGYYTILYVCTCSFSLGFHFWVFGGWEFGGKRMHENYNYLCLSVNVM